MAANIHRLSFTMRCKILSVLRPADGTTTGVAAAGILIVAGLRPGWLFSVRDDYRNLIKTDVGGGVDVRRRERRRRYRDSKKKAGGKKGEKKKVWKNSSSKVE